MSRSVWKPTYLPASIRHHLQTNPLPSGSVPGSSLALPERATTSRSTPVLASRVGRRFHVHNGLRFLPIERTEDRVGHRLGEFIPTRKRPPVAAVTSTKAKAKK